MGMQIYPDDVLSLLEFDKVLGLLAGYCAGVPAAEAVMAIIPMRDAQSVQQSLQEVSEMKEILQFEEKFPELGFADIRESLKMLAIENYVLTEERIHLLRSVASSAGAWLKFLSPGKAKYPALSKRVDAMHFEVETVRKISAVLDDDGHMRADASPALVRIRKSIDSTTHQLDKAFRSSLKKYRDAGFLSEVEESMRNNRRVLGIQSEYKRQLRGIIHDESDTGRTVFIEPEEVVVLQNTLFELGREETREIYRILQNLSNTLRPLAGIFEMYQHLLTDTDLVLAKAKFAVHIRGEMPRVQEEPRIALYTARHPLLMLWNEKLKKETIPLNIEMDTNRRIVVISGPNAGGKSVAMKTIGLLQLMVQCGMMVPVSNHSVFGIFHSAFCDIGDTQSLEDELSTYSSRLVKLNYFLRHADAKTLLLIDEFGSGTDPQAGAAIAEAGLHLLNQKKTFAVITTHYANLKTFAASTEGIFNANLLFDENVLKPLYILESGKPGSSYAFEIAQNTGLPETVISEARSLLSAEHINYEALLKSVRIEMEQLRERARQVEIDRDVLQKRASELGRKTEELRLQEIRFAEKKLEKRDAMLQVWEQEFREMLEVMKTEKPEAGKQLQRKKMKEWITSKKNETGAAQKELKADSGAIPETLHEGDVVRLAGSSETGIVRSVHKHRIIVQFPHLITEADAGMLQRVLQADTKTEGKKFHVHYGEGSVANSVDVRGMTKEEALAVVEQLLDAAVLHNLTSVHILHGKGTGALRQAIRALLKNYRGVKKFGPAPAESGGDGITLVEL